MSYEFYITLGVAIFSGGIWLYKKSKAVYSTVRKIRNAFKTVNIDPKSTLTDEQYKKIAIGALYASQQGAYQNSIKTGIAYELPKILGEWWGIENTTDAKNELDYLLNKGFRYYFPFVWQAYQLDDPEKQDEIFQKNMTSQEDYDKVNIQLQNLIETYYELVEYKVISSKEDIKRYGVTGWDAGRICFLARACCEMCYISEAEAWEYIDKAYEMAHNEFSSWKELAMSYIIGRALWGGKKSYNSVMKDNAEELLTSDKSPWTKFDW